MGEVEATRVKSPLEHTVANPKNEKDTEHKEVLKSLLDLFLEHRGAEDVIDVEDGTPVMSQHHVEQIEQFLMQVCMCYQSYGCSTHTIEVAMEKVARGLGVEAHFIVFPAHAIFELAAVKTDKGEYRKRTQFFRTSFGYNFYKLQLVDELARRIAAYAIDTDVQTAQATDGTSEEAIGRVMERARSMSETMAQQGPLPIAEPSPTPYSTTNGLPPLARPSERARTYGTINRNASEEKEGDIEQGRRDPTVAEHVLSEPASPTDSIGTVSAPSSPSANNLLSNFNRLLPNLRHEQRAERRANDAGIAAHGRRRGEGRKLRHLGKTILKVARLGPNAYSVDHDDDHDHHHGHDPASPAEEAEKYKAVMSKLVLDDGIALIRAIVKLKPLYPDWLKSLLLATASFSACALFFGGSWTDSFVAFLLGLLVARIEFISKVTPSFSRVFEFVGTFVASIIVRAIQHNITGLCYRSVVMSTIVFSLQGTTITLAFIDLMTKDMITGTTRLFYGMLISAMIGFAMDLSTSTYAALSGRSYADVTSDDSCGIDRSVNPGYFPLLFIAATLSFNMITDAHYKQLLPMEIICAIGYVVYYFGSEYLNNELPTLLAAFTSAASANLYCRFTGQPPIVYIIPVAFLLVPGSIAASTFFTAFTEDLSGGIELAFSVVSGALSIAIGFFLASAIVQIPELEDLFTKLDHYPGPRSAHAMPGVPSKTHRNSALII